MKESGKSNQEIQKQLKIKNRSQIYTWVGLYEKEGASRLERTVGRKKKEKKPTSENNLIKTIIKKKLANTFRKNRKLYLDIIDQYKKDVSLNQLIKWLNISKNSYYRWLEQSMNPRPHNDLEKALFQICKQNSYITTDGRRKRRLGYRVVHQELKGDGFEINAKTVLKLMHKFGLLSERIKRKPQYYYDLAIKKENNLKNLIQNNYETKHSLEKLCTDITYIPFGTNNKKLFVSAVMDLHNREIISYNISKVADVNFVLDILKDIPKLKKPCVIHSDRGSVYTSKKYQTYLKNNNLIASYSAIGTPTDNACMESFWGNMKRETIHYEKMQNLNEFQVKEIINNYIKYYNAYRKIKVLNYLSPLEYKNINK